MIRIFFFVEMKCWSFLLLFFLVLDFLFLLKNQKTKKNNETPR